jgi:hypothetical protein
MPTSSTSPTTRRSSTRASRGPQYFGFAPVEAANLALKSIHSAHRAPAFSGGRVQPTARARSMVAVIPWRIS